MYWSHCPKSSQIASRLARIPVGQSARPDKGIERFDLAISGPSVRASRVDPHGNRPSSESLDHGQGAAQQIPDSVGEIAVDAA